jgi:nucleoside recognition membrane protein YjiH
MALKAIVFTVTNGVKQSAVLRPVLSCVYLDDLLDMLSNAGTGCIIRSQFVRALAYADDRVVTASTTDTISKLLAICDDYAHHYTLWGIKKHTKMFFTITFIKLGRF